MNRLNLWANSMIPAAIGGAAALLTVLIWYQYNRQKAERWYAAALVIAALIYVAFALAWDASAIWLELGGVVLYTAFAILGLRYSPWFLALGWLAHVGWDVGLHGTHTAYVPSWYPLACLIYDLIIAVYIIYHHRLYERKTA